MSRNKTPIVKIVIDGEITDAKMCSKCITVKPLTDFHKCKGKPGERDSLCKECAKIKRHRRYIENKDDILEKSRMYREQNREKVAERHRRYKAENKEKVSESNRLYREKNREKIVLSQKGYYQRNKEYYAKWRALNKDKISMWTQKRRAIKHSLPNTLTNEDLEQLLVYFDNQCALSGETENVELDHFIPLKTGKGGTTVENIIPLSHSLNSSKKDSNPFEWIETRPDIDRKKFDAVVEYLSEKMGMGVDEYRHYVYSCFDEGGE